MGNLDGDNLAWRNTLEILRAASRIADRPTAEPDVRAAAERVVAECLRRLRLTRGSQALPAVVQRDLDRALLLGSE
jgi:hypothetical protein